MDLTGATSDGGLGMAGGSTVGDPFPWSSLGIGYTDPTTANPTTNQQWFSKALEFASSVGYDPSAASEALGRYLAGIEDRSSVVEQGQLGGLVGPALGVEAPAFVPLDR